MTPGTKLVRDYLDANLGQCPKCVRQSFIAAAASWMFVVIAAFWQWSSFLILIASLIAATATLLWLSHLLAFALRAAHRAKDDNVDPRRNFVRNLCRGLAFVTLTSALPGVAFAQIRCTCRAPTPKCCYNYDGTSFVCAASTRVCCAHSTSPWSCPSGQNCDGTNSCR